jgi:large subunit ribosomal protein L3
MGDDRVTVKKLQVVKVDTERNLILVKGAVPGARNAVLLVQKAK